MEIKNFFMVIFTFTVTIINAQPDNETVKDIEGNIYKTMKIGNQVWMVEFLRTTKFADGSDIPLVTDNEEWSELKTGAYCNFYNNEKNSKKYGRLYNWYAVNNEKGLCPKNWHIPDHNDWIILDSTLRSTPYYNTFKGWWSYQIYGSSYLPPDYRTKDGNFINEKSEIQSVYGAWWTSVYFNQFEAWCVTIGFSSYEMMSKKFDKACGFCVLCIKDN